MRLRWTAKILFTNCNGRVGLHFIYGPDDHLRGDKSERTVERV
jgi:hypothetical protein